LISITVARVARSRHRTPMQAAAASPKRAALEAVGAVREGAMFLL